MSQGWMLAECQRGRGGDIKEKGVNSRVVFFFPSVAVMLMWVGLKVISCVDLLVVGLKGHF